MSTRVSSVRIVTGWVSRCTGTVSPASVARSRASAGNRSAARTVTAATFIAVPSQLANIQPALWEISRPWYLAWAGLVYVALAVATLAWMVVTARRVATGAADRSVTQITAG